MDGDCPSRLMETCQRAQWWAQATVITPGAAAAQALREVSDSRVWLSSSPKPGLGTVHSPL